MLKDFQFTHLDNVEKEALKDANKELSLELGTLQQKLKEKGIPVVIVIEGMGASGKGSMTGKLIKNLDPRGYKVHALHEASMEEKRRPWLYRYWLDMPATGEIAIFDRSWYMDYSDERLADIRTFERELADDGCLLLKFFIHITEKEQKERLEELLANDDTSWRVSKEDLKENKKYKKRLAKFDTMLELTDTEYAPWHVVSGMNKASAQNVVFTTIIDAINERIEKGCPYKGIMPANMNFPLINMPKLSKVDLSPMLTEKEYKEKIDVLQDKLNALSYKLYRKQIPLIIGFEGWDAAGKGGTIKRVASGLDARDFDVFPIASLDYNEKARHFLWRFWKRMPKSGHTAIFDRTWYGRVMVERIERFCSANDWKRAYNEINEFEKNLSDWGAIVIKFWMHIDKATQLERFNERQNTPEKRYKITDEDWRNREKWDKYERAVDEMIKYTSTEYAPWYIIESDNKYYGRIKTLEIIIDTIERRLEQEKK